MLKAQLRYGYRTFDLVRWPISGIIKDTIQDTETSVKISFATSTDCESENMTNYVRAMEKFLTAAMEIDAALLPDVLRLEICHVPNYACSPADYGWNWWRRKVVGVEAIRFSGDIEGFTDFSVTFSTVGDWETAPQRVMLTNGFVEVDDSGAFLPCAAGENRFCGPCRESTHRWLELGSDGVAVTLPPSDEGMDVWRLGGSETWLGAVLAQSMALSAGQKAISCYVPKNASYGNLKPWVGWMYDDFAGTSLRTWWSTVTAGAGAITVSGGAVRLDTSGAVADAASICSLFRWPGTNVVRFRERFKVDSVTTGLANIFYHTVSGGAPWTLNTPGNRIIYVQMDTANQLHLGYYDNAGNQLEWNGAADAWQAGAQVAYTAAFGTVYRIQIDSTETAWQLTLMGDSGTALETCDAINWAATRSNILSQFGAGDMYDSQDRADLTIYGIMMDYPTAQYGTVQVWDDGVYPGWVRLWGTVNAIDHETALVGWQLPDGEVAALTCLQVDKIADYKVYETFSGNAIEKPLVSAVAGGGAVTVAGGECRLNTSAANADGAIVYYNAVLPADKIFRIRARFRCPTITHVTSTILSLIDKASVPAISAGGAGTGGGVTEIWINQNTAGVLTIRYWNSTGGNYYWNPTTGAWQSGSTGYAGAVGTTYRVDVVSDGTSWQVIIYDANDAVLTTTTAVTWALTRAVANSLWVFSGDDDTTNYRSDMYLDSLRIGPPVEEAVPTRFIRFGEVGNIDRTYVELNSGNAVANAAGLISTAALNRAVAWVARGISSVDYTGGDWRHLAVVSSAGAAGVNPTNQDIAIHENPQGQLTVSYMNAAAATQYWDGSAWGAGAARAITLARGERLDVRIHSDGTNWWVLVYNTAGVLIIDTSSAPIAWANTRATLGNTYIVTGDVRTTVVYGKAIVEWLTITYTGWGLYNGIPYRRYNRDWTVVTAGAGTVTELRGDAGFIARERGGVYLDYVGSYENMQFTPQSTILFWISPLFASTLAGITTQTILGLGSGYTALDLHYDVSAGQFQLDVDGVQQAAVTRALTASEWIPCSLRLDGLRKQLSLTIDGVTSTATGVDLTNLALGSTGFAFHGANYKIAFLGWWNEYLSDAEVTSWLGIGRLPLAVSMAGPWRESAYMYEGQSYDYDGRWVIRYVPGSELARGRLIVYNSGTEESMWMGVGPISQGHTGWFEAERATLAAISARQSLDAASFGEFVRSTAAALVTWETAITIDVSQYAAWYKNLGRWRVFVLCRDNAATPGVHQVRVRDAVYNGAITWNGEFLNDGVSPSEIGVWKWLDCGELVWPPQSWESDSVGRIPAGSVSTLRLDVQIYRASGGATFDIDAVTLVPSQEFGVGIVPTPAVWASLMAFDGISIPKVYGASYQFEPLLVLSPDTSYISGFTLPSHRKGLIRVLAENTTEKASRTNYSLLDLSVSAHKKLFS